MTSSLTPRKLRAIKLAEDKVISYILENKIEQSMFLAKRVLEEERDIGNQVKDPLIEVNLGNQVDSPAKPSKAPNQMDDLKQKFKIL